MKVEELIEDAELALEESLTFEQERASYLMRIEELEEEKAKLEAEIESLR